MVEWIGYILARTIAGVLTALILKMIFNAAKQTSTTPGTINSMI
jgi:hypothetical protein